MRTILSVALIAGFAFAFSASAFAVQEGEGEKNRPDPAKFFQKKDTNGDGKLSKEEFLTDVPEERAEKAAKRFEQMDKDSDGFVTLEEFKEAMHKAGENRKKKDGEKQD